MKLSYFFTRKLSNVHWTVEASFNGHTWDITFSRGPVPHWHTFNSGACLWEGFGEAYVGYQATRIQVLRFIVCGLRNLMGFSVGSSHNQPCRPSQVHTFKAMKSLRTLASV